MSVIERQVNIRIEVTVSNAFNISILSKASSMATNDKTANIRDDNSDEQCPCEDIQIRFPVPDAWVYMFRVEKRFRYGAIHSVRRKAGKIKVIRCCFVEISFDCLKVQRQKIVIFSTRDNYDVIISRDMNIARPMLRMSFD
jgi:hypothetical protein